MHWHQRDRQRVFPSDRQAPDCDFAVVAASSHLSVAVHLDFAEALSATCPADGVAFHADFGFGGESCDDSARIERAGVSEACGEGSNGRVRPDRGKPVLTLYGNEKRTEPEEKAFRGV